MDTKLHEAVRYGDSDDVRKALAQGYDPNLIGLYLWNPVQEAAHNGEAEILALLLRNKGKPNQVDQLQGNTALHYACKEGHVDCLKLLLRAGGQPHIKNNDDHSAADLATPACLKIIQQHVMERSKQTVGTLRTVADVSDDLNNNKKSSEERKMSLSSAGLNHTDKHTDFPAMGHLHLSFEYHVHKGSLKIRVWQVSDLLLPPPQTSMIHTIFVRSYLVPDKPKKTNRKTEEIRVTPNEAHILNLKATEPGIQHIFTPSNFHFTVPLQYTGVTKEIINERSVQIEVCMTQKFSRRIFLIGMIKLPLKKGVKMLIREKFPLIPCMNYTIPNNMKVYSSCDIELERSNGVFYSSPALTDMTNNELMLPTTARSASDVQLQGVQIQDDRYDPSVLINMPDERNGTSFQGSSLELQEVKVKKKIKPDFSTIDIPVCDSVQLLPGQLEEVKVDGLVSNDKDKCVVNVTLDVNKFSDSHTRRKISPNVRTSNGDMELTVSSKSRLCSRQGNHTLEIARGGGVCDAVHSSPGPTRAAEPLDWDYYDFDTEEETKLEKPVGGPMPPCLPMTVGLILPSKEQTSSNQERMSVDFVPEIRVEDFDSETQIL